MIWLWRVVFALTLDSRCSDVPTVTRERCLQKDGCMWLETASRNLCLLCSYKRVDVPCAPEGWPPAGFVPQTVLQNCESHCAHENVITKISPCTDVTGISWDQCSAKGRFGMTKCMWTSYIDAVGGKKSMCGPCNVVAVGVIPCAEPGMLGPEAGTSVTLCRSMCDGSTEPVPPCEEGTKSPPAPPPAPMSVLVPETAPEFAGIPVMPPYGNDKYTDTAVVNIHASRWKIGNPLPNDSPVVVYGTTHGDSKVKSGFLQRFRKEVSGRLA